MDEEQSSHRSTRGFHTPIGEARGRGRGQARGAGMGKGRGAPFPTPTDFKYKYPVSAAKLVEGLGESDGTISKPLGQSTPVEMENFEALSSYNWIESTTPTIVVPGASTLSLKHLISYAHFRLSTYLDRTVAAFRRSS